MDDEHKKFEKELAKIHTESTFVATVGSVFALLGITLLVFGLTATLESVSKNGEQTCLKCGQVNPISSKFCNKCGVKIVSACEKCGQVNPDDASFCNKCGFTLK